MSETTTAVPPMESATLGKLGEALAKAQGAMRGAKKDSLNPHFKSSYADLASVWDACRDPLSQNGLSIIQQVTTDRSGVTVTTTLLHISGEFLRDRCWLPVAQQTPHAFGSAITYARRYSLAALVGVAAEEDDDGNAATVAPAAARRVQPQTSNKTAKAKTLTYEMEPPPPSDADAPPPQDPSAPDADPEPDESEFIREAIRKAKTTDELIADALVKQIQALPESKKTEIRGLWDRQRAALRGKKR